MALLKKVLFKAQKGKQIFQILIEYPLLALITMHTQAVLKALQVAIIFKAIKSSIQIALTSLMTLHIA
ncbi:hypothetical protein BHY_1245 (plasmid) [Borrelia nietonii YOR]|uniref:Uncharacterized protein n=2 Tax=Borrelia TaxID=138 RepID=W5SGD3_9SPIR|nr:hypothetical protein BHY_1245 [Borrelia nietonii YOR]AHH14748.1 hypothetical protein BHW_0900057 [Borrelia hermsii MTW]